MDTEINQLTDNLLDQVLIQVQYSNLASQLLNRKGKKYLIWKGPIYALFLEFHLIMMRKFPQKIPSFMSTSRRHLKFDEKFSKFVLKKISVEDHVKEILLRLLKKACKTKFSTMKKYFKNKQKGKDEDYINLIPSQVKKQFDEQSYPKLFKELERWENEKTNLQKLQMLPKNEEENENQNAGQGRGRKRKVKKIKEAQEFD